MFLRLLLLSSLLPCALGLACRQAEPPAANTEDEALVISGRYDVRGVTTVKGGADKRRISGTVVLVQKGDRYDANFELKTKYPSDGVPADADVIGVGEGEIDGRELRGTTRTQIVVSSVPGVDTAFAFVPRRVSTRIVSDSIARFHPDGTILIELENRPEEGHEYIPTLTRMTGRRVADEDHAAPDPIKLPSP